MKITIPEEKMNLHSIIIQRIKDIVASGHDLERFSFCAEWLSRSINSVETLAPDNEDALRLLSNEQLTEYFVFICQRHTVQRIPTAADVAKQARRMNGA